MTAPVFRERIRELKESVARLVRQRSERPDAARFAPATIWSQALRLYSYLPHLAEDDFADIRFHAGLVTGESPFAYWHQDPAIDPDKFAALIGYDFFSAGLPENHRLGEAQLGDAPDFLGIRYKERIINRDIARFQSCVANLSGMGVIDDLRAKAGRSVVVEIGAGYGGLASALAGILGDKAVYLIVDIPEMFLFSAAYLMSRHPEKRFCVFEPGRTSPDFLESGGVDFVFVPNFACEELRGLDRIDLLLNTQSFQEMSEAQIGFYLNLFAGKLAGSIYSDNLDRHPHNPDLAAGGVTAHLERRFNLFPEPGLYRRKICPGEPPWFYKSYFGSPLARPLKFSRPGPFKVVSGESRIGGSRWTLHWRDGRTQAQVKRNPMGWLIAAARRGMRLALRQDLKIYYQLLESAGG